MPQATHAQTRRKPPESADVHPNGYRNHQMAKDLSRWARPLGHRPWAALTGTAVITLGGGAWPGTITDTILSFITQEATAQCQCPMERTWKTGQHPLCTKQCTEAAPLQPVHVFDQAYPIAKTGKL